MKRFLLASVVLAAVPVAAFAQTPQDWSFAQSTTHMDLAMIQDGQDATTTATIPAVRAFAQQMVQYHTHENQTLAPLIPPLPTTMSPCTTWQSVLVRQAGSLFDSAYLLATVYNHQRLINVLQGEMQAGNDPNLKAFAQRALPDIQAHLAMAQQLQAGIATNVQLPARVTVRPDHPNFRSGQWDLSSGDQANLDDLAHKLAGLQQVQVIATGYTDTVRIGPELARQGVTTNEILSEKRAESVKAYLVAHGVPAAEIQTQGMGPANPVASNATEEGRAQNRRVEVDVKGTNVGAVAQSMTPLPSALAAIPRCDD